MDWRHNRQSPKSSLEKYPTSGGFLEYQDDVGDDWEDIEESSESYRNERIRPQHAEQRISNSPGGAYTCGRPPLYVSHSSSPPPRPPEATSQAPATPPANPSRLADMTSFLDRAANSNQTKFAATAVLASAVTAGAIFGFQALRRHERVEDLKASIPELGQEHKAEKLNEYGAASPVPAVGISKEDERSTALAERAQRGDYDNELILEQLARNRVFLTDEGLEKLRNSFIIVVGVGGVGSHAVAALARSGASHIRIIDFDQVSLSSLNRHSVATLADVGTPKVHCLRKRLQAIVPWCSFDCRNQLFSIADADNLLGPTAEGRQPDWVIDAIDNIDSKVALLAYCHQRGLKVISSMGAGCKSDPTRIFIGDISTSSDDPLSRSCRRRLRAPPYGISCGIPVVYSSEKPGPGKASLLPLPEEEFAKGTVGDLAPMQDFRVRILPVLGTMPAAFGLACANHVILSVAGHPLAYVEAKGRDKMYDGILAQVQASEEKVAKFMAKEVEGVENVDVQGLKIPLTAADVGYVVEEVFRGKSVLSGVPTRLALVRWRRPETVTMRTDVEGQKSSVLRLEELVCMTKEEAQRHEKEVVRGSKTVEEMYDSKVLEEVRKRMEEERWYERFR